MSYMSYHKEYTATSRMLGVIAVERGQDSAYKVALQLSMIDCETDAGRGLRGAAFAWVNEHEDPSLRRSS